MNEMFTAEQLAETVNEWCALHGVIPANGQAAEEMSVRNIRYYRAMGLLDPPLLGGGQGFGEKHRLQLLAVRLLQAQGLPLQRIQQLLFGRSTEDLKRIEEQGLAELEHSQFSGFQPASKEYWCLTPLDDEFMLVSRRGRALAPGLREEIAELLRRKPERLKRQNGCGRSGG
jgi:DNA-binding transcriptional MerR regulator